MQINIEKLLEHFDQDKEMIQDLVLVFEESYPDVMKRIETAFEENNLKNLELEAHTLKGMVLNFFCDELNSVSQDLEKKAKAQDTEAAKPDFEKLKIGLPKLLEKLKEI